MLLRSGDPMCFRKVGFNIKKEGKRKDAIPIYTRIPPMIICGFLCVSVLFAIPADIILSPDESFIVPNTSGGITDYCLRGREILLFCIAILLVLFWLGERMFPDRPQKSIFVRNRHSLIFPLLCGGYLLFAVLSSVFGKYPEVSFWGFATESEGLAAALGYLVLFLACYEYFRTKDALKVLSGTIFVITAVIDLLFLIERLFGPLILIIFGIPDERTGTAMFFGNSSNCGDFCAVISIAAMGCALAEEKRQLKFIKALCAGGTMLAVITTFSSAAVYGMICGIILTTVLFIVRGKRNIKSGIAFAGVLLVPIILFSAIDPKSALTYLRSDVANGGAYTNSGNFELSDISINDNILSISDSENTLIVKAESDESFIFTDVLGNELKHISEGKTTFDQPFSGISAEADDGIITLDLGYDSPISFAVYNGTIQFVGMNGYLELELDKSAFPELSEFYRFGTGRGYIWLNTLPLLSHSVILGCGAGQFPFFFPQNDIVGSLNTHGTAVLLTDKPHCMYIGIAVSYGIPALLIFIAITVVSLRRGSLKNNWQSNGIYAGIIGSIFCFLIMGIANDSNPVISPLFWSFLGVAATADNIN